MCKPGNTRTLEIDGKPRSIDSCIYDFVKILNDNGYKTFASCCGHGKQPTRISYDDNGTDKEIIICNYDQATKIGKLFPPIGKVIHDVAGVHFEGK